MWDEVVEKTGDREAKVNLKPSFYIKKIDFKCRKCYCLLIKKDKENANREHHNKAFNKDKEEAKSYNHFFANQSQA